MVGCWKLLVCPGWSRSYPILGRQVIGEAGAPSGYLKVLYHASAHAQYSINNLEYFDELFKMTAHA